MASCFLCPLPPASFLLSKPHPQARPYFLPQAWLFWNPEARSLCIAFRGTEQAKWKVGGLARAGVSRVGAAVRQMPEVPSHCFAVPPTTWSPPSSMNHPGKGSMLIKFLCLPPCSQDILTDLLLVPASLDPEGLAERPWVPRSGQQAEGGPPNLEAAVVRWAC